MYDPQLGLVLHRLLVERELENPVDFAQIAKWDQEPYLNSLESKFAAFIHELGFAPGVGSAQKSAQRIVDFFTHDRFKGLDYRQFPQMNPLANQFGYTEPLIARDIVFRSTCEHHLVPIIGKILIGYRPQTQLLGLAKLNQIVVFFAKRPQLQERLTRQLLVVLQQVLATVDVAVVINARHDCMASGGVNTDVTIHSTYQLSGVFDSDTLLKQQILGYLGHA